MSDMALSAGSENGQIPAVQPVHNPVLEAQLHHIIANKTMPTGALGRVQWLAHRIGMMLDAPAPMLHQPQLLVFAADHGIAAQGVSAYPSDVTWQMVQNFLSGGAAVNVFARQHHIAVHVVDCGVRHDFVADAGQPVPLPYKIEHGTQDSTQQPAMTAAQCQQALGNGMHLVRGLPGNALLLGEMGIGNTSAAALLMARIGGYDIADCTGSGTGLDRSGIQHKTAVLQRALQRHADVRMPLDVLAALGGFEIATMTGAVLQAAAMRKVVVVDGFISTAAVLVAHALRPAVLDYCVFSHCSAERGHALMLRHLGAQPLLALDMRLGEGSAAALAWPLLQSACLMLREMASFASAGVSDRTSG